jgi:flagellar biosynthesis protein FlhG
MVTDQAQRLRELFHENRRSRGTESSMTTAGSGNSKHQKRCMSLAITSGKGGVGKSAIALQLAITLSQMKKKVLVLDADLGLANIHLLLGIAPKYNIAHVVEGERELEEIVCTGPAGIDIIPAASGVESMANISEARLGALQRQFSRIERRYDYIFIDTGAGIGRSTLSFAESADQVLLVVTPEPTSLADAYATAKLILEKGAKGISVIVNMASNDREGQEIFDKLNSLVLKFLKRRVHLGAIVPYDREITRMIKRQRSIMIEAPQRVLSRRLSLFARKISGYAPAEKSSFFSRLFGRVSKPEG